MKLKVWLFFLILMCFSVNAKMLDDGSLFSDQYQLVEPEKYKELTLDSDELNSFIDDGWEIIETYPEPRTNLWVHVMVPKDYSKMGFEYEFSLFFEFDEETDKLINSKELDPKLYRKRIKEFEKSLEENELVEYFVNVTGIKRVKDFEITNQEDNFDEDMDMLSFKDGVINSLYFTNKKLIENVDLFLQKYEISYLYGSIYDVPEVKEFKERNGIKQVWLWNSDVDELKFGGSDSEKLVLEYTWRVSEESSWPKKEIDVVKNTSCEVVEKKSDNTLIYVLGIGVLLLIIVIILIRRRE